MSEPASQNDAAQKPPTWVNTAVDYGPLLVFLIAYFWGAPDSDAANAAEATLQAVLISTGAFIVAAIIALLVSKLVLGHISKTLMLSTILIVGFGGLTIALRDAFWVQIKPTAFYLFFGSVLIIGWLRGKALMQYLLEAAFEGVTDEGWLKLSRNWGFFFVVMAGLNEVLRLSLSFGAWLTTKFWAFMLLTFLFSASQIPMLLKHGLDLGLDEEEADT